MADAPLRAGLLDISQRQMNPRKPASRRRASTMPATATPPVTSAVRPFFPIVYVRGYAGTQQDVEDTVADPFMGFNLGSSKIRQRWSGEVQRHYFESPLVRLMKDYSYRDAYCAGQ